MAVRRHYKGGAVTTTLNGGVTSTASSIVITDATGWPDGSVGPFYVVIDKGLSTEESVLVTSRSSFTLSGCTRGQNDTVGTSHASGAAIQHVHTKTDSDEANLHVSDGETDPHSTKLLNNTRHDTAARHTIGTVIAAATTASSLGTTTAGSAATLSRGDHVHGFPALTAYTPTWKADTTDPSLGNGTSGGRYGAFGKILFLSFYVNMGSTTSYGSGDWYFPLPGGLIPVSPGLSRLLVDCHKGAPYHIGFGELALSGGGDWRIYIVLPTSTTSAIDMARASSARPSTWVSGQTINVHGWIEVT